MASTVTPERIKSVLSSFLVKTDTPISKLYRSRIETSESDTSPVRETSEAEDATASSAKSNTAFLRSHKSFLSRLASFSARTWFSKPVELSPLVCARYGWENVDTDMLQCVGCKAFLCGKLPSNGDLEGYNRSVESLKKKIVTAHDRFCVLAAFPCSEEFCHIQVDDVASLSASFFERASALSKIQDQLPKLSVQCLEDLGYDEGQAGAYCKRHLIPDMNISPVAVTLAFTGWTCSPTNREVLMCSKCCRKIGLWNFVSPGSNAFSEESSEEELSSEGAEPKLKKRRKAHCPVKEFLNPVEEHNHWCPWIQQHQVSSKSLPTTTLYSSRPPSTPSSCEGSPGGEQDARQSPHQPVSPVRVPVFIAALKSIAPGLMDNNTGLATGMKKSPMTEGLRCFRRALDTWSSPKASSPNVSPNSKQSSASKTTS